ncbi:hypothetical protein ACTXQV_68025, partial [Klebsiella pneumoniae]
MPDDLQRLARFWGTERLAQNPCAPPAS